MEQQQGRDDGWLVEEERVYSIVGGFFDSFQGLGFGFMEPLCAEALARELIARGHRVQREVSVQVLYKGKPLGWQRLDFIVDDVIVIEIKATAHLHPNASRQLFNYLRATGLQVGLLLHYGEKPRFYRVYCKPEGERGSRNPEREKQ
ncbi:MAG TPA: GxxExxY protein [Gemmatimonadaceae bacterium]|nr:GxxExxY protein [Gemmatimonadaceae bacterium]